jgi:D-alanine-D-alanine ligase
MVERFIPGRELTCAVMGDVALGVIDIVSKASGLV